MASFLDIAFNYTNDNDEDVIDHRVKPKHKSKTLHPLSTLPFNVSRELLVEKYCKLLECFRNLESEKIKNVGTNSYGEPQKDNEIQRLNKLVQSLTKQLNEKDNRICNLQQQLNKSASIPIDTVVKEVPEHIINENKVLKQRCYFLENNNHILTKEIEENKKISDQALNLRNIASNEAKKKIRMIRKQQKTNYLYYCSQLKYKKNINNLKNIMLTPIPGIGYKLKQRLIAYISQNRICHIEELKGKIEYLGKKRLEILKTIFSCNPNTNNDFQPDNVPPSSNNINEPHSSRRCISRGCLLVDVNNLPLDIIDENVNDSNLPFDNNILDNLVKSLNKLCI
jgi:hypothetical protein